MDLGTRLTMEAHGGLRFGENTTKFHLDLCFPPPPLQCHLHRGVHPFHYTQPMEKDWTVDVENRFLAAIGKGKKEGYIVKGSTIVLLSGWKPGPAHINTIRIFQVD